MYMYMYVIITLHTVDIFPRTNCIACPTLRGYQNEDDCFYAGTWQNRDESANLLQKHDVELIKDAKRYIQCMSTYTLYMYRFDRYYGTYALMCNYYKHLDACNCSAHIDSYTMFILS